MNILILLIGLLGLPAGFILAKIAYDELKAGKKYFLLFKQFMYIITVAVITYSFITDTSKIFTIIFVLLALGLFLLKLKEHHHLYETATYLLFIVAYLLTSKETLIASSIFIYSLPTATLFKYGR